MQHSRLISIVLLAIACGGFMGSLLWAISILCEFGVVYFYYQARAEIVFFLLGILFWGLSCFYVGMKFFLQPHKAIDEGIIPIVKKDVEFCSDKKHRRVLYVIFAIVLFIFCLIALFKSNDLFTTSTMYFVQIPDMKYGEVWDADKLSRNKSRLYDDHPDVFVAQLSPLAEDDSLPTNLQFVILWSTDHGYKAKLVDGVTFRRERNRLLSEHPTVEIFKVI